MPFSLDEGTVIVTIAQPFTFQDFAGPWGWIAIRYYWFVFDDLALEAYVDLARAGRDPTDFLLLPALNNIAGDVEPIIERTPFALRFVGAQSGSVKIKLAGAFVALKKVISWLPIYGKWIQEKGQIDIETEIKRSKALQELKANFMDAGIPDEYAFRLAFHRLYNVWPDFYLPVLDSPSIHISEAHNTGKTLSVDQQAIEAAFPQLQVRELPPAEPKQLPTDEGSKGDSGLK
jgi:hypothetical protein